MEFFSLIAGPSLKPRIPVRWVSVSSNKADPSMQWSRKAWKTKSQLSFFFSHQGHSRWNFFEAYKPEFPFFLPIYNEKSLLQPKKKFPFVTFSHPMLTFKKLPTKQWAYMEKLGISVTKCLKQTWNYFSHFYFFQLFIFGRKWLRPGLLSFAQSKFA